MLENICFDCLLINGIVMVAFVGFLVGLMVGQRLPRHTPKTATEVDAGGTESKKRRHIRIFGKDVNL